MAGEFLPPDADMWDGWPQIAFDLWDKPGIHIVGLCTGPIRDVGSRGAEVEQGVGGEHTIFPRPVQTQYVMVLKDGVPRMEVYDRTQHGPIGDIRLMETTPPELLEQLYGDGGTQKIPQGQTFANTRKGGASHTRWGPRHHPKPRR